MRSRLAPYVRLEAGRALRRAALPAAALATLVASLPESADPGPGPARHRAWTIALLVLLPLATAFAAERVTRWRRGENAWLASRPVAPTRVLVASFLGTWLASLAALLAIASVTTASTAGGTAPRLVHTSSIPRSIRIPTGASEHAQLPAATPGTSLRVRVMPVLGGTGPTTTARITVSRGATSATTSQLVVHRTWIEVPLAAGEAAPIVTITNEGPGDLAWVGGTTLQVWSTSRDARRIAIDLVLRAALCLAASLALALGLGAWVSTGSATGLVFVGLLWTTASPAVDVFGIGAALEATREARLPRTLGWTAPVLAVASVVVGLTLGRTGLRGRRADV